MNIEERTKFFKQQVEQNEKLEEDMTKEEIIERLKKRQRELEMMEQLNISIENELEPEKRAAREKELKEIEENKNIVEMLKRGRLIKYPSIEMLGKEDIKEIFKCEDDKALKILRLANDMNYGTKMGKEYYIRKEDLDEFLEQIKGRNVKI